MKFCPECGKVWNGSKFCAECGKDLRNYIDGSSESEQAPVVKEEMAFSADFDFLSELDNLTNASEQASAVTDDPVIAKALAPFEVEKLSNGKYKIIEMKNYEELSVVIPDCVQIIGDSAFLQCDIVEVVLSEGLIKIEKNAFDGCCDLVSINFPKSLRIIEDEAFCNCESLDVEPPKNVKLGEDVFYNTLYENKQHTTSIEEEHPHKTVDHNQEEHEEDLVKENEKLCEDMYNLASDFFDADDSRCIIFWEKAAKRGHAFSQYMLGSCYASGIFVEKNKAEAIKWLKLAAQQGLKKANEKLDTLN